MKTIYSLELKSLLSDFRIHFKKTREIYTLEGATAHNYVSWNEGKWLIRVNAPTDSGFATGKYEDGDELAQTVVDYLETNYLPAPDERGVFEIDDFAEHSGTIIRWQQGSTVYEIDESTDNPIDALQIAVESAS